MRYHDVSARPRHTPGLLNVKNANWALDTSDALAVAVCHLTVRRFAALAGK